VPPDRLFANWSLVARESEALAGGLEGGSFEVAEQDFTAAAPDAEFDIVLNCRAFQGLSRIAKCAAAQRFFGVLRPGGVAVIDTMNLQGSDARNEIEDCLAEAGFYVPFSDVERWYRQQLDGTGISYGMVMGRPRVSFNRNNSIKNSMAQWERDQSILDSFAEDYKARQNEAAPLVKEVCGRAETVVAYVIYPTG
jgi:hypothetical protein